MSNCQALVFLTLGALKDKNVIIWLQYIQRSLGGFRGIYNYLPLILFWPLEKTRKLRRRHRAVHCRDYYPKFRG